MLALSNPARTDLAGHRSSRFSACLFSVVETRQLLLAGEGRGAGLPATLLLASGRTLEGVDGLTKRHKLPDGPFIPFVKGRLAMPAGTAMPCFRPAPFYLVFLAPAGCAGAGRQWFHFHCPVKPFTIRLARIFP